MKLYTEEQVKEMLSMTDMIFENDLMPHVDIISCFKPIEPPSDEEMEKKANNWCTVELDEDGFVRLNDYYDLKELPAFIAGAKWMRDKILNQNK